MSIDTILWFSGILVEATLIGLLLYYCVWRNFPVFVAYSIWTLGSGICGYAISRHLSPSIYLTTYLGESILDSVLLFSVLVELAWSLLRPIRTSLSRSVLVAIVVLILVIGGAVWPFTVIPGTGGLSREMVALLHLQQTVSILQIIVFLAFVASTQLLSIGWRDRELQIATGLGISSLVEVTVAALQQQPAFRLELNLLNRVVVGAYLCSLFYWVVSFSQKEEQRREFTPQMQSMLLAVAGAARATRIGLTDSRTGTERNKSDW